MYALEEQAVTWQLPQCQAADLYTINSILDTLLKYTGNYVHQHF
jgi:hypothetical protein